MSATLEYLMRFVGVSLVLIFALPVFCGEPKKIDEIVSKYKIGMSMADARKLMSKEYKARSSGLLVDDEFPLTNEDREKHERWKIHVEDEGVALYFNANNKLLRIRRVTSDAVPEGDKAKSSSK